MDRIWERVRKEGKQECDSGEDERLEEHTAGDTGDEVCSHSV